MGQVRGSQRQMVFRNTAVFSIQYGSSLSSCRQKSRDRGYCLCKMLVSSGGSVENAFVARNGNEALDGNAVEAVYNWSFSLFG